MLVATVSAGNEENVVLSTDFVVVAIKVSMGCVRHFKDLRLCVIIRGQKALFLKGEWALCCFAIPWGWVAARPQDDRIACCWCRVSRYWVVKVRCCFVVQCPLGHCGCIIRDLLVPVKPQNEESFAGVDRSCRKRLAFVIGLSNYESRVDFLKSTLLNRLVLQNGRISDMNMVNVSL